MAWSLNHQADIAHEQGDVRGAREFYEQALGMFRELDLQPGVARCLVDLGGLARKQGDPHAAQSLFTQALAIFHELGETVELAAVLEEMVGCAVNRKNWDRAVRLAAARLRTETAAVCMAGLWAAARSGAGSMDTAPGA